MGFWDWVFRIIDRYGMWFLVGARNTLLISITGTVVGFAIGLLVAVLRTIPKNLGDPPMKSGATRIVNILLSVYIEVFRGTPMMVQGILVYYGLMEAFQIDLAPITAGILVVSINTGAYMAEIARGGIEAIDKGQYEAAQSIGMNHTQTMLNVILPQAIRNILPATGNEFVINIKDTSVLSAIMVSELFFMTNSVKGAIYRTFEPFFITCVIYLILTFTVTRILRLIERKLDGPDSYEMRPVPKEEKTEQGVGV